jgi:hypothetical protein
MATSTRLHTRTHELAFRTQLAELKERVRSTPRLLPGTPGTLVKRSGTGRSYWYRVYQSATGKQVEELVGRDGDETSYAKARDELAFAKWVSDQVRDLRRLEFQVADKAVGQVLVELHNAGFFQAGLCVVGTLGYMAWLNELGIRAVTARTQDIDLAARQDLKLAAPRSFLEVLEQTRMPFNPVPGLAPSEPSSSVKLPGAAGLRVDLLTSGPETGQSEPMPTLHWHAQTVAHYDYLLEDPREAAVLAGSHCIPVRVPAVERFVWHKLYSGVVRKSFPEKAAKDLRQAATLAAALAEQDEDALADSATALPKAMRKAVASHWKLVLGSIGDYGLARQTLERALGDLHPVP